MSLSAKLQSVEHRIGEKTNELEAVTSHNDKAKVKDELHKLTQGREKLRKQRLVLDAKLQDGCLLSPPEDRRCVFLRRRTFKLKMSNDKTVCRLFQTDRD